MDGRTLQVSEVGYADQASAAASLVMGEAAEGRPLVVVRGLSWSEPGDSIQQSLRPAEHDLFK